LTKSDFVFQGIAFDAYGTKPEQIIRVSIPAADKSHAAYCQTCVVIPTLMSNDLFTKRVVDIYNTDDPDPKPHILPFLKDQKRHYEFREGQYSCLSVNIAYNHDFIPCEVSMGVIEASKMMGYAFKKSKQPETFDIRNIRQLGQELIKQEQTIKSRFLGLREQHSTAHDEAINTILMEHANTGLMHYARQTGMHFIERHYNLGGGYNFARTPHDTPVPKSKKKSKAPSLLGQHITIPQDTAMDLFYKPQKNRFAQAKFTKPDRLDCALNLHIAHLYRDNNHAVTTDRIDRIVSILNYTP
jgi:hypothetical protein